MKRISAVFMVAAVFALLFAACGDPAGGPSGGGGPTVTGVTVSPGTATVFKGGTQTFTAAVAGTNSPAQTVTWSIDETVVAGTAIDTGGVLTVAAGETAASLTVRATSAVDTGKSSTATVTVLTPLGDQINALDAGSRESPTVLTLSGGTYPMTDADKITISDKHIHIKVPAGQTALIELTEELSIWSSLFTLNANSTLILGEDSGGGTLIIDGGNHASPPVTGTGSLIYADGENISVEIKNGVILRNNTTTGTNGGGAILIRGTSSGRVMLTISGGTISGNKGSYGGGISMNIYTTLTMTGGLIENNTANTGGGICSWNGGDQSIADTWPVITISGGEIRNNTATGSGSLDGLGGGVFAFAKFTLTAGTIHDNSAEVKGGGIYRYDSHANSSVTVPGSWTSYVYDNTAPTDPQISPEP
jgi:hypothetical protein